MPHPTQKTSGALSGFSLVELMIVVVVIAILALIAMPNYVGHLKASRMSEGVTGMGVIRNALQLYSVANDGKYPTLSAAQGDDLDVIGLAADALNGKFFKAENYLVTSTDNGFTIRATLPDDATYWCQIDHNGNETKGYQ